MYIVPRLPISSYSPPLASQSKLRLLGPGTISPAHTQTRRELTGTPSETHTSRLLGTCSKSPMLVGASLPRREGGVA